MSHHSMRVVSQPNRLMYSVKSLKEILEEHETNLINYNEAMSNVDAHLWQRAMEAKLKSIDSNKV